MTTVPRIALISLYVIENSGIRLLAAMLRRNGFRVTEIYFKDWTNNRVKRPSDRELADLVGVMREEGVALAGVSVRASAFIDIAAGVTSRIRDELKIPLIWGGIHATSLPEECIKIADAVCVGEAEDALVEFVEKFFRSGRRLPRDVANFWVRSGGEIFKNPPRPLRRDLDGLPLMDFHSHRDKYYIDGGRVIPGDPYVDQPMYVLLGSRGCIFGDCSFCINTMLAKIYPGGYAYRRRSVSSVIGELLYAKRQFKKLKRVRFDDEIFPLDRAWVDEFCLRYRQEVGLPFECHLHPLTIREDHLARLITAGLDTVAVGIQNTERINRHLYNRRESNRDVRAAAEILHRMGVKACYQVIVDDPISTPADKMELFNLLIGLPRPFELYLFSLTIYPGTALAGKLLADGLITEAEIEGQGKKVFSQFRVDLGYRRSPLDTFWVALLVMVSKNFIPRRLLVRLAGSEYLRRHPGILVALARSANLVKLSGVGFRMLLRGELTVAILKRWLNFHSLITQ